MSKFSCSSSRCLLLDKLPYTPLFFAVLIEGLLVNVFHDKAFPLLPFMLLPFTLDSQKVQGSATLGNQINFVLQVCFHTLMHVITTIVWLVCEHSQNTRDLKLTTVPECLLRSSANTLLMLSLLCSNPAALDYISHLYWLLWIMHTLLVSQK